MNIYRLSLSSYEDFDPIDFSHKEEFTEEEFQEMILSASKVAAKKEFEEECEDRIKKCSPRAIRFGIGRVVCSNTFIREMRSMGFKKVLLNQSVDFFDSANLVFLTQDEDKSGYDNCTLNRFQRRVHDEIREFIGPIEYPKVEQPPKRKLP